MPEFQARLIFLTGIVCLAVADGSAEAALFEQFMKLEQQLNDVQESNQKEQKLLRDRIQELEMHGAEVGRIGGELQTRVAHLEDVGVEERRLTPAFTLESVRDELAGALDHVWLLLCGALVMFMQAGFAMVEAGSCTHKSVQNIMMKNAMDVCLGTLCWYYWGWGLAYGFPADHEGKGFAGSTQFFGHEFSSADNDGNITPTDTPLNWFFQWAFCSAASTIVSGGVAERINFPAYVCFTLCMTSFVYPVVVAWTWGGGWLSDGGMNEVGYFDFAGSGIVHMCGGVGALVGASILGPRTGRFENPDQFAPHSTPLIVLGTFILWFGWYGFNCGSTLGMANVAKGRLAAQVAMNTTIAAATGGLVVWALRFAMIRKFDVGGMCNGILAGLVSITAPCGNVEPGSAFLIAMLGGLVYQGASSLLKLLKVDDPIDAFALHGACGAWGVLCAVFFDWGTGFSNYNGWRGFSCTTKEDGTCNDTAWSGAFGAAIVAILAISAWTAFWSVLIFLPLRFAGVLRASDDVQTEGMDCVKHSPTKAYSFDGNSVTKVTPKLTSESVHRVQPWGVVP